MVLNQYDTQKSLLIIYSYPYLYSNAVEEETVVLHVNLGQFVVAEDADQIL